MTFRQPERKSSSESSDLCIKSEDIIKPPLVDVIGDTISCHKLTNDIYDRS